MASARRSTRRFAKLREEFYQQGKRLDADPATRAESVCWICKQRIDYDAAPGSTEDSHELDHVIAVSLRPDLQEDPSNFAHSHRRCNAARGNVAPTGDLGDEVPAWW
ncbi:HNH endonuclease [Actinomyces succiniciruminis]|uniref:HNH endonuclease n=1 Tax=Actinomyces succiniciruminis TaxID=1522002 RepID=UPI001B32F46D|nr:HNH endonuclease [Actinomyces succiniciruminis]